MVRRNQTGWLCLLYNKSRCYNKPTVHLEMCAWKQIWQSKSRSHSPFVCENHRSSKNLLIIKAIYQPIISIPLFLSPFYPPTIWRYWQIFLKNQSSRCLCRLIGWAPSRTSGSWLLSNNLISQMEKQHLFSCSSTYGSQCCCVELKQVVPRSTALQSPAAPQEWPPPPQAPASPGCISILQNIPPNVNPQGKNAQTCI